MKYIICVVSLLLLSCNTQQDQNNQDKNNVEPKKKVEIKTEKLTHSSKDVVSVLGVDVSHFQGDVDWSSIKKDGVLFAYAKATQGSRFIDPKYMSNWKEMKENKVYKGAYHFFEYDDDVTKQVNHFLKTVKYSKLDLPPVLDLEGGGVNGKVNIESYQKSVLEWLNQVEKILGVKPIIYTNVTFGNTYLNKPEFSNYDLWLAEYTKEKPELPEAWLSKGWLIWQRSEFGKLNGINGNVDHDLFNGDLNHFNQIFFKRK